MGLVPPKRQGDEDELFNPRTSPQPCCYRLGFPSLAFTTMNRNDFLKISCDIFSHFSLWLQAYVLLLTWQAIAVGWDALGSGRKELVQDLLRKRMINGDGGVKGAGAPVSSTTPLLGIGLILVPLCCGFSGCALAWDHVGLSGDDDSRFPLLSSARSNLLVFFPCRSFHTPG